jgi:predicted nucleic acid-binding protein
MSSTIIFDAGPIISLTTNNLLWILEKLKERYEGDFLITKEVFYELVQVPIESKRFKLEALEVNREINKGTLKVIDHPEIQGIKKELLQLANNCFFARGIAIKLVHEGEIAAVAAAIHYDANAIVIDERTTRELIENPDRLAKHMSRKLETQIDINRKNIDAFRRKVGSLKVIRSIELAVMGYDLGWFDSYLTQDRDARKTLKEALLWGMKMRGASISQEEIDRIVKIEK